MNAPAIALVPGSKGATYQIAWDQRLCRWTCSCPDWQYRQGKPWDTYQCKHIKAHLKPKEDDHED